jgi:hypothetical protein
MYMDAPRGLKDEARLAERRRMLETVEHVRPLVEWKEDVLARRRARRPDIMIPDFDPAELGGGIETRALMVFEAPGPKTVPEWGGSGFISTDNDDPTAQNNWLARNDAGMHEHTLSWNICPWVLGKASVHPGPTELAQGAIELRGLMRLLPDLRVVVLCGLKAQQGWTSFIEPHIEGGPSVIRTWHPSNLSFKQPDKREEFTIALARAASRIA